VAVPPPPNHDRFVIVKRVSTQKQGADGLGISAQHREIQHYLHQLPHHSVIKEFVEVESGGKELHDRPVLQEAIDLCRKTNSILLVSRLSRLSRDAAFVLNLMKDSSIQFRVAAMPSATNLQLGIYALLNEEERRSCSVRTKNALAAARSRGVKLGNPKNLEHYNRSRKNRARQFADQHAPLIWSLRSRGKTLRDICAVLNESGMKTPNGGAFHPVQVSRILRRSSHQEVVA